jgi:GTP-binding protein
MAIVRITAAEFVTSAASARDLLQTSLPELAIAGRSNVGKSTLINVLAGRTLARTSAAPGKTRLANYYRLQPSRGPAFHLVDLPGYGYARGARDGQAFDTLAREYFFGDVQGAWIRPAIAGVILLVDARHPGLDSDAEAFRWFGARQLVGLRGHQAQWASLRAERQRTSHALTRAFGSDALMISAPDGEGIDELWTWIARQLDQWTPRKP